MCPAPLGIQHMTVTIREYQAFRSFFWFSVPEYRLGSRGGGEVIGIFFFFFRTVLIDPEQKVIMNSKDEVASDEEETSKSTEP